MARVDKNSKEELRTIERELERMRNQHLTGDQLAMLVDETDDEVEMKLAGAHLARCVLCRGRLAEMKQAVAQVDERLEFAVALRRLRGAKLVRPAAEGAPAINIWLAAEPLAAAARGRGSGARSQDGELGLLRWRITERGGAIIVTFASHEMQLAGATIRVQIGGEERSVELVDVGEGQVAGRLEISEEERRNIPPGMVPEIVSIALGETDETD